MNLTNVSMIVLDMDGLIADFTSAALAVHEAHLPYESIRWDFHNQIGVPDHRFWTPFDRQFWANIPPTPEIRGVIDTVMSFGVEVIIATHPCRTEGCCDGKRDWVNKHLPELASKLVMCFDKSVIASPDRLLIDDNEVNVDSWRKRKAPAMLFPRPWNRRRNEEPNYMERFALEVRKCFT